MGLTNCFLERSLLVMNFLVLIVTAFSAMAVIPPRSDSAPDAKIDEYLSAAVFEESDSAAKTLDDNI